MSEPKNDSSNWPSADPIDAMVDVLELFRLQRNTRSLAVAWTETFDVQAGDNVELFRKLASLHQLHQRVIDAVVASGKDSVDIDATMIELHQVLGGSRNLAAKTQAVASSVDTLLPRLRMLGMIVASVESKDRFDESMLDHVFKELLELETTIQASGLPDPAKRVLCARLSEVRAAIREIRIRGLSDLEEAVDAATGAFITNGVHKLDPELADQAADTLSKALRGMAKYGGTQLMIEGLKKLAGL